MTGRPWLKRRTTARMSLSGWFFEITLRALRCMHSPQRAWSVDAVTTTTFTPDRASGSIRSAPSPNLPRSRSTRAIRGFQRLAGAST